MKKAKVKIDELYQCCEYCDDKIVLGNDVVGLENSWYCSNECAVKDNGGHSSTIESFFFDDGKWEVGDNNYFEREYKEEDKDLYEWRNAKIVKEEEKMYNNRGVNNEK